MIRDAKAEAQQWADRWAQGGCTLAEALSMAMYTGAPVPPVLAQAFGYALDQYEAVKGSDLAEILHRKVTDRDRQKTATFERRMAVRALVNAGVEEGYPLSNPNDWPDEATAFHYAAARLDVMTPGEAFASYYELPAHWRSAPR